MEEKEIIKVGTIGAIGHSHAQLYEALSKITDTFKCTLEEAEQSIEKALGNIKTKEYKNVEIEETLDEFELAGFHLTEELKESLINCGITAQILKSITSEKDLIDKIAEKWNELCNNEAEPLKKKTKVWNKKKFYE